MKLKSHTSQTSQLIKKLKQKINNPREILVKKAIFL